MTTGTVTETSKSTTCSLSTSKAPKRRDVQTTLNYYRDPGDGSPPTPVIVGGNTVTNERPTAPTPVIIHDITGSESTFTLDTHGFQLVQHQTSGTSTNFSSPDWLTKEYYPESEALYKKITNATHAHIFAHTIRRGPTHWHTLGPGNATQKGPLHRVHIDQSYSGADLVLRKHLPASTYTALLASRSRWQIVNLWRPLRTIFKDPLAVGAAGTFGEEQLVQAEVRYVKQESPLNRSLTWAVRPPAQEGRNEWFYKNEQGVGEVWFIKCFDSWEGEGVARRAPHCAFVDGEREGGGWEDRESVEVRAVLIYD
ncbi:hypothetical protein EJ04DRAFT_541705 [Polyplosphaeria fusca]|uniref:Uncharacterized protein n=1 Tax=Polyplosphaeria fusca TaxID=682080 RepID=A0A9P4R6V0_9PLEO|nr:hypothetical protein EJ04DRAFT_541705 [Polyplosphaeria fusca]